MSKTKKKTAHRGIRIAPKNTGLIAQKKIQRKLASRNISHTESIMAGRAGATGKLTIMKKVGEGALEKLREKKEKK
jgi:hypothetical protein